MGAYWGRGGQLCSPKKFLVQSNSVYAKIFFSITRLHRNVRSIETLFKCLKISNVFGLEYPPKEIFYKSFKKKETVLDACRNASPRNIQISVYRVSRNCV